MPDRQAPHEDGARRGLGPGRPCSRGLVGTLRRWGLDRARGREPAPPAGPGVRLCGSRLPAPRAPPAPARLLPRAPPPIRAPPPARDPCSCSWRPPHLRPARPAPWPRPRLLLQEPGPALFPLGPASGPSPAPGSPGPDPAPRPLPACSSRRGPQPWPRPPALQAPPPAPAFAGAGLRPARGRPRPRPAPCARSARLRSAAGGTRRWHSLSFVLGRRPLGSSPRVLSVG